MRGEHEPPVVQTQEDYWDVGPDRPMWKRPGFWAFVAFGGVVVLGGTTAVVSGINSAAESITAPPAGPPPTTAPQATRTTANAAPTTSAAPTTTPESTPPPIPTTTAASPSWTTTAPTTTVQAPAPTPTRTMAPVPAPAPAPQTEFAINCSPEPAACTSAGRPPVYDSPYRGVNDETYALNAVSGGHASTGIRLPASNELKPLCRGTLNGVQWLIVQTDASWAEPQKSGQGNPYSGYVEASVVPGAAGSVGDCASLDYTHRLG